MTSIASWRGAGVLAALLMVAGCGGGGELPVDGPMDGAAAGNARVVPAAAGQSPTALVRFLASLGADDTGEPLQVGAFQPPRSDTAEPEGID